ncbi:MAG: hypothetical protein ACNI27_11440 [Desulfovibrio sp.]
MSELIVDKIKSDPEFDIWYYSEVSGEKRISQKLLDQFEVYWDKWSKHINSYSMKGTSGNESYLLIYLDQEAEKDVDEIWADDPSLGLSFHNLAITMVMTAAQGQIKELTQNKCAPLPAPGMAVQEAFDTLGLVWKEDGTINRRFAVFTNSPYTGGCEICFLEENCPKSQTKKHLI